MTPTARMPITRLLTLSEAGHRLGLSDAAVVALIHAGVFARLRVAAGAWRLRPEDVAAYRVARSAEREQPATAKAAMLPPCEQRGYTRVAPAFLAFPDREGALQYLRDFASRATDQAARGGHGPGYPASRSLLLT